MKIAVIGFNRLMNASYKPHYRTLQVEVPQSSAAINDHCGMEADNIFASVGASKWPLLLGLSAINIKQKQMTAIDDRACNEVVCYALSKFNHLDKAIRNLREVVGIPSDRKDQIGFVNLIKETARSRSSVVVKRISHWARFHGFEAVIWKDLPSGDIDFSPQLTEREIIRFLDQDEILLSYTAEYIKQLPKELSSFQRAVLYRHSLISDFFARDAMPQTKVPYEDWFEPAYGRWGPKPATFPEAMIPYGVCPSEWKRERVIATAKHFCGLPYKRADGMRGHFPARGCGLDCSNFVSWVYNYGLGIRLPSHIEQLAASKECRQLDPSEELKKGDLIFINGSRKHVAIYIDENHVIDSTSSANEGVQVRDMRLKGNERYLPALENRRFLEAKRVVE